ncbi:hypothetical protein V1281_004590 [Nitrobacteraceae bacterium AZCC 2161]
MHRNRILKLGQTWHGEIVENRFWIGATTDAGTQHGDGLVVLGRDCGTIADLEGVALEIREELDRLLDEVRRRAGSKSTVAGSLLMTTARCSSEDLETLRDGTDWEGHWNGYWCD